MKKLLLLVITGIFLMSCGGGWSEGEVAAAMKECQNDNLTEEQCECMISKAENRFDSRAAMKKDIETGEGLDDEEKAELLKWLLEMGIDCGVERGF